MTQEAYDHQINPEPSVHLDIASIRRRTLALCLDLLIMAIPVALASMLMPVVGSVLVVFLYAPLLEASPLRGTLGKHLVGIQIVDEQGGTLSLWRAIVRNMLKFVSTILLLIGFIVALFTRQKQSLHDLLVDSYVVYGRTEGSVLKIWKASLEELIRGGTATLSFKSTTSVAEIERLQGLRERGALSDDEFELLKKRILAQAH